MTAVDAVDAREPTLVPTRVFRVWFANADGTTVEAVDENEAAELAIAAAGRRGSSMVWVEDMGVSKR